MKSALPFFGQIEHSTEARHSFSVAGCTPSPKIEHPAIVKHTILNMEQVCIENEHSADVECTLLSEMSVSLSANTLPMFSHDVHGFPEGFHRF